MSNQTLSEFTAVDARTSLGNRESDPPFQVSRFWGGFHDSRFPSGRESGIGNRESGNGPFPDRPGTGNRGPDSAGRGFPGLDHGQDWDMAGDCAGAAPVHTNGGGWSRASGGSRVGARHWHAGPVGEVPEDETEQETDGT
jgi:hypothetical protein